MMDYFLSWCIDEAAIPKIRNKNTCFGFCRPPRTYVFSAVFLLFSAVEQMFVFLCWITRTNVLNTCFDADMLYYNQIFVLKILS